MKVLFVDDDALNRRVVRDMLNVVGVTMDEAESGAEGLTRIDDGDYNLVLMDLRMPLMDGLEATRRLRARSDAKARLPVIVVTADTSNDLRQRCEGAGADEVLMKPVAMASLLDTMGRLLQRGAGLGIVLV